MLCATLSCWMSFTLSSAVMLFSLMHIQLHLDLAGAKPCFRIWPDLVGISSSVSDLQCYVLLLVT